MIRHAVSNIALSPFDHANELKRLPELGLSGLEVAPSRVWIDTWKGLGPADVDAYRRQVEDAGLSVVGLHSLFFDHPELGLFDSEDARTGALEFLIHLSGICRDLGGRTLIYGGGRKRGDVALPDARAIALDFLEAFVQRVEDHGTCLCFEPLGLEDSDFINSAYDSLNLVRAIDHPAFRLQLDAKALLSNDEIHAKVFDDTAAELVHFHANEPGLSVLGASAKIDHTFLGQQLGRIGYKGFVSIEQRMFDGDAPLSDVAKSANVLLSAYG